VNIVTALAENESVVRNENDPERKAIALAWLFHLVGDVHLSLHAAQLFTVEYPQGDRGREGGLPPGLGATLMLSLSAREKEFPITRDMK
jgi:hypothetical protein